MSTLPESFTTFSVTSGSLCFGDLGNIWSGASAPPVRNFPVTSAGASGTVKVQSMEYNIPAKNGTWIAYKLVDTRTKLAAAWFVCHEDTNPEQEVDKILRVSGSPYEENSGSTFNDANTQSEGVFVINRYDWSWYDRRGKEMRKEPEEDEDVSAIMYEAAGLVDYTHAKSLVTEWKDQRPYRERSTSQHGIWMPIPDGEYMFGRFGFDDSRTAARSFMFFTTNTVFNETAFEGRTQTLR